MIYLQYRLPDLDAGIEEIRRCAAVIPGADVRAERGPGFTFVHAWSPDGWSEDQLERFIHLVEGTTPSYASLL